MSDADIDALERMCPGRFLMESDEMESEEINDMVVVKIELWPHGDESKMRPIGRIDIANDGSGEWAERGNYDAKLCHAGVYYGRPGFWKRGKVNGYIRTMSPYHLVAKALAACGVKP